MEEITLDAIRAASARIAPLAQRTPVWRSRSFDALAGCATPWACPHGRPTALVLSELELARKFGRRGPRAIAPKEEVET